MLCNSANYALKLNIVHFGYLFPVKHKKFGLLISRIKIKVKISEGGNASATRLKRHLTVWLFFTRSIKLNLFLPLMCADDKKNCLLAYFSGISLYKMFDCMLFRKSFPKNSILFRVPLHRMGISTSEVIIMDDFMSGILGSKQTS